MDSVIIRRYILFLNKIIVRSFRTWSLLVLSAVVPILMMCINSYPSSANGWNRFFFTYGNHYFHYLFLIPVYIVIVMDIVNDGPIMQYILPSLRLKRNWLFAKFVAVLLWSIVYTCATYGVSMQVAGIWGNGDAWSEYTLDGNDMYTLFYLNLLPKQAVLLFAVRFFIGLLFISALYISLQCITRRRSHTISIVVVVTYLALNIVMKIGNVPILRSIDISNLYVFHYESSYNLTWFLAQSNLPLSVIVLAFISVSMWLVKEADY
ncbi:hypothetical protein DNH61_12850 [Paenibacillus sambharensis]|uniref:Uncharacterized protein n=1 Tax=Paenibacillus sambharensis TaxID=1803190 RepID=A0A2W1L9I7_9BACL|nr:hypothetical protein DNH61_12850 [Paenibacillus sambharensis]